MRAVVFFVCLCFLFQGSYSCVRAAVNTHPSTYSSGKYNLEAGEEKKALSGSLIEAANLPPDGQDLFSEAIEDEDDDDFLAGKYRLIAAWLAFCYLLILSYLSKQFKFLQSFQSRPSYLYLLQRVLRI